MLKLMINWRWMGKHRHLRRMRYPWLKVKFGLLWRLCFLLIVCSPVFIPYIILKLINYPISMIVEWCESHSNGQMEWLAKWIGYSLLVDKQDKANQKVYRWRHKMGIEVTVMLPREKEYPPNADSIFIRETIAKLDKEQYQNDRVSE